jgi:Protein of unknown function (DUF3631)
LNGCGEATMAISRCCAGKRCVGAKTTSRPYRLPIRPFRILSTIGLRTTGAPCWPWPIGPAASGPKRARNAALVLSGDSADGGSIRTQLLADIRLLLSDETIKGLTSEAIVGELVKKPDRPWTDWKNGKAITPKALAGLLRPFGIFPHQLSVGDGKELRGYARHALENAFSCYLPPSSMCRCVGNPTTAATSSLFSMCRRTLLPTH